MSVPVLIDTSLLTVTAQYGVDIRAELQRLGIVGTIHIFAGTNDELARLAQKNTAQARAARLALSILQTLQPRVLASTTAHVDDDIVAFAQQQPCVVCVQDKDLKKRLAPTKAQLVTVRQKSHLAQVP